MRCTDVQYYPPPALVQAACHALSLDFGRAAVGARQWTKGALALALGYGLALAPAELGRLTWADYDRAHEAGQVPPYVAATVGAWGDRAHRRARQHVWPCERTTAWKHTRDRWAATCGLARTEVPLGTLYHWPDWPADGYQLPPMRNPLRWLRAWHFYLDPKAGGPAELAALLRVEERWARVMLAEFHRLAHDAHRAGVRGMPASARLPPPPAWR